MSITSLQIGQNKIQLVPRADFSDQNSVNVLGFNTTLSANVTTEKFIATFDGVLRVYGSPNSTGNFVILINGEEARSHVVQFDAWIDIRIGDEIQFRTYSPWTIVHSRIYHYK